MVKSRKKKRFERRVIYCPKCGSNRLKWVLPQLWSFYDCPNCGYRGTLVVEDGELAEKIRNKWKAK